MDEVIKELLIASPYAAAIFLLGRMALLTLQEYLRMVVYRHDQVLARLSTIERELGIKPPPVDAELTALRSIR